MRKHNSWKTLHLERLQYLYGEHYRRWNGKQKDDRELYCRMYEKMEAALRSLPAEPNLYVTVAMDEKLRKDRETLDRIAAKYRRIERRDLFRQAGGPDPSTAVEGFEAAKEASGA